MRNSTDCLPGIRRPSRWGAVWLAFHTHWNRIGVLSVGFTVLVFLTAVPFMSPNASRAAWRTTGSSPAVTSPAKMSPLAKELAVKRS